MGMGNFDEREYERREKKLLEIQSNAEEQPAEYRGKMTFETGDSTDDLLKHFKQIKSK